MVQQRGIAIGQVIDGGSKSMFRLGPEELSYHATIWGRTGSGKSKLLQAIFLQLLTQGQACCIIEPHQDLSLDTLSYLVASGFFGRGDAFDRLIYLDWGNGSFVPFNVLALEQPSKTLALHTLEAMMRVWPELRRAPSFQTLWLSAVITLAENKLPLTRLYQLLTESEFRRACLERVHDPLIHQSFCTYETARESLKDAGSTLRRAFLISFDDVSRFSLGAETCGLDFRQLMDQGKSVILNLGNIKDSETRRLIGAMLLVQIEQAALSRTDQPAHLRRPFFVFVDEWPSFSAGDSTIGSILAQTRKFGLRLYLAAQASGQISSERVQAAIENCGLNIVFGLGRDTAVDQSRRIASIDPAAMGMDPITGRPHHVSASEQFELLAQDLQRLSIREAYVKLRNASPVKVRTLGVRSLLGRTAEVERVLATYRDRYQIGRERAQTSSGPKAIPPPAKPAVAHDRPFTLFADDG